MKIRSCLILFIICLSAKSYSQIPEGYPSVNSDDLPGLTVLSARTFNGKSLFGYIDGGAELYLEYGFSLVTVSDMEYMGGRYKTEIYKMNGPEEAFGIFSVSKYKCAGSPALATYTCQTKYQLQICKGPYYISIINRTGTKSDSVASVKIGSVIAGKVNEKDFDLSFWLPGMDIVKARSLSILVKGRLGTVNGSPDLEDFLSNAKDFTAVIFDDGIRHVSMRFDSDAALEAFLGHNKWINEITSAGGKVKKISDLHILFDLEKN
jgi:hypothetical protein